VSDDCFVCRKIRGDLSPPGGPLYEDDLVYASHVFDVGGRGAPTYLGHLIVETRRHARWIAELSADEAAAVGRLLPPLARALVDGIGADWVYTATIGTGVPHFHLHVVARYPDTPRDLPWHSVDEWDGALKGGPDEIAATVERIRSRLRL
jgi:diadenosine tetraphosphate (Ap4A) HIT family hydrolase